MVQCPDCKSTSVQSKGYRTGAHRYLCNSCGRNFTIRNKNEEKTKVAETIAETAETAEIPVTVSSEVQIMKDEKIEPETEKEKANQTLNVRKSTKEKLMSMKVHERETVDDVISRLILFQGKLDKRP